MEINKNGVIYSIIGDIEITCDTFSITQSNYIHSLIDLTGEFDITLRDCTKDGIVSNVLIEGYVFDSFSCWTKITGIVANNYFKYIFRKKNN